MMNHLELAHDYWKRLIRPGDLAIDATCGNGHDTLALATLPTGKVYALDLQSEAIEKSRERVKEYQDKVIFIQCCHSLFPEELEKQSVKLIVYNLGYLPGGDKSKTTMTETTLQSIENAMELVSEGGAISITCYPGHPEGKVEEKAVLDFVSGFEPSHWGCIHHRWCNRKAAPSLVVITRMQRGKKQDEQDNLG